MTDEKRRIIEKDWPMKDVDMNGRWTCGWREPEVGKLREMCETLIVELEGRELDTTSDRADGDDGKGKGKDKGEGQSDQAVGEETLGQGAEGNFE